MAFDLMLTACALGLLGTYVLGRRSGRVAKAPLLEIAMVVLLVVTAIGLLLPHLWAPK